MAPAPLILIAACCLNAFVGASSRPQDDGLVDTVVDTGTFQSPSSHVRPYFRYWIPDASVDHSVLASDVKALADAGGGGFEALGFYLYNDGSYAPSDWSEYGWGTPAWKELFKTLVSAHQENGLFMDFPMGPNQGQGVPAVEDSEALAWDLTMFNVSLPPGGSFDDTLPGLDDWDIDDLHAVITADIVDSQNITVPTLFPATRAHPPTYADFYSSPSLTGVVGFNRTQAVISSSSLKVVTDLVTSGGNLKVEFESKDDAVKHHIFVLYQGHSKQRAQNSPVMFEGPQTTPQTWLQNGSWLVDHYSALGAKTTIDFWEKHLLTDGIKELLMEAGNYGWEDSLEFRAHLQWTKNLPQVFSAMHGYDITKWLPLFFHQNSIAWHEQPDTWFLTDEEDYGNSHVADYRKTLTNLYGVYLKALTDWTHEYLGLQFSAQIAYNLPTDMLQNIPVVDAPECETLGFTSVDAYRQYAGAANLAGKRVISLEAGADWTQAYEQTYPDLLAHVKLSIAGSVNRFVFHGFSYSDPYGNTTWPGYTTFNYHYAGQNGPRDPGWQYISDAMDFAARLSYIFQSGIPKMDFAFYQKITNYVLVAAKSYAPTDMEDAGYSYEYISPENFDLPEAYVEDGVLAPNRQAFKAMIIRSNDSMTHDGVLKLADYAMTGLPLIFLGGLPTEMITFKILPKNLLPRTLGNIVSLPNVHVVGEDELLSTIESIGLAPLTRVSSDGPWFTYWREDANQGLDYVFVFNNAREPGTTEGTVEFASTGIPYFFDAWTGAQTPILNYTKSDNTTKIFFRLAANQSTIVTFSDSQIEGMEVPSTYITGADKGILGFRSNSTDLFVHSGHGLSPFKVITSDNVTHQVPASPFTPFTLGNWTLGVESWTAPANFSETVAAKQNLSETFSLPQLISWQEVKGLEDVSGIGFYETEFIWPPSESSCSSRRCSDSGAMIDFGRVVNTLRVKINGQSLPPLDVTWAQTDISSFLVDGRNVVEATVSTTLLNALRPHWTKLRSSRGGPTKPTAQANPPRDYGLLSDVVVTPYCVAQLSVR